MERPYSSQPTEGSSGIEIGTAELIKGADSGVWQVYSSGAGGSVVSGIWAGITGGPYWRFFTVSPPTGANNENVLDFQSERELVEIDKPPTLERNIKDRIDIVTSLPEGPSHGDIVLLTQGGLNNIWYYTGAEQYNAIITSNSDRAIAHSIRSGSITKQLMDTIVTATDRNYFYMLYSINPHNVSSWANLSFGNQILRRFSISTGAEDVSYRKTATLNFGSSSYYPNSMFRTANGVLFATSNFPTQTTTTKHLSLIHI